MAIVTHITIESSTMNAIVVTAQITIMMMAFKNKYSTFVNNCKMMLL